MNKLLVICGPTATGKTSASMVVAKRIDAEIVSADSRQVYIGMDIGTGKDFPKGAKLIKTSGLPGYYKINGVKIWGYDLISPKSDYSVHQYTNTVTKIIRDVWKRKKVAILEGGTGLYIKSVVDGIDTVDVPKNDQLRKSLSKLEIDELYEKLAQLDGVKAGSLNSSDRKNPRRLIRAIEIAQWSVSNKSVNKRKRIPLKDKCDLCFVGLYTKPSILKENIEKRVDMRVKLGIVDETEGLLADGVTWKHQSMNALGYRQLKSYFEKECSLKDAIKSWKAEEIKYAKRQITWFKKDTRIKWFDINGKNYPKNMEKCIKRWYKEG